VAAHRVEVRGADVYLEAEHGARPANGVERAQASLI
jgi:hypothetical protein